MHRRHFLSLMAAMAALPLLPSGPAVAASRPLIYTFGTLPKPAHIRRVMAAGSPASVLIYALAPHTLLGWPMALSGAQRAWLPSLYRDLPHLGRLAGRGSTLPMEKLLALKPDLIVDVGTVDDTYLSLAERVYQQTGIPYVLVDGRLPDCDRQLLELGELLGVPERARHLADYARSILASVPAATAHSPSVYLARGADGLETGLPGSINTEVITVAGARHATRAGIGGNLAQVSLEQLLQWQPDIIVTQDEGFFAQLPKLAAWKLLKAVQQRQCFLLPSSPFGWLDGPPGINRLPGLIWLAGLQSAPANKAEWATSAQQFYGLFYGTERPVADFAGLIKTL